MKTNKSYSKRLRVTKKGKVVARNSGHNHFNARANTKARIKKGQTKLVALTPHLRARFLPNT